MTRVARETASREREARGSITGERGRSRPINYRAVACFSSAGPPRRRISASGLAGTALARRLKTSDARISLSGDRSKGWTLGDTPGKGILKVHDPARSACFPTAAPSSFFFPRPLFRYLRDDARSHPWENSLTERACCRCATAFSSCERGRRTRNSLLCSDPDERSRGRRRVRRKTPQDKIPRRSVQPVNVTRE